jgi:hypothetical protein
MSTPYQDVYDAFLSKITADDWAEGYDPNAADADAVAAALYASAQEDWRKILENALPYFKFPAHSMKRGDEGFEETLSSEEIAIISEYMKIEWLNRTIATWENVKVMYDERDWSPANLLKQFISLLKESKEKAEDLERIYYRSVTNEDGYRKPFAYSNLAGK